MSLPFRSAQALCSASCPVDHIDIAGDKIKKPLTSWPDIRGFHSLNYSRDKWLTGGAIEVSIAAYCHGLPQALQEKIGLGIPDLDPRVWRRGPAGDQALEQVMTRPARRLFSKIKSTEYSIFPICAGGNHWVLVVIHKEQRPSTTDASKMEWSHITQMAVLDPFRVDDIMNMVITRLTLWLRQAGKFTFATDYQRRVWIPLQKDQSSCGPRAYWNAKQIIDRLLELHERKATYHTGLWNELSGWFDEDFVRSEMLGRCASTAVREMDYKARIAIECVNQVREHESRALGWRDAGELMRPPPDLQNRVPETRPQSRRQEQQPPPSSGSRSAATAPVWQPPALVTNSRLIAPGLRPTAYDTLIRGDSADPELTESAGGRGPAWRPAPSTREPLLPPSTQLLRRHAEQRHPPSTPRSSKRISIDLTVSPPRPTGGTAGAGTSSSKPRDPRPSPSSTPKTPSSTRRSTKPVIINLEPLDEREEEEDEEDEEKGRGGKQLGKTEAGPSTPSARTMKGARRPASARAAPTDKDNGKSPKRYRATD